MVKKADFGGIIPAMLTPFTEHQELDIGGIRETVNFLIESGVSAIMCNGSTGEEAALTRKECIKVVEATVAAADGRVKVIAGAGAPATREVIERSREAKSAGADSVMIVTPFYEIPSQDGLYRHYETIAGAVDIPIVMYNIPPHTNVEIRLHTLEKLVEIDNIVALKDSSGNLSYFAEVIRTVGEKISVLTGGDDITLPCFTMGCSGAILALANIAPHLLVELYNAVKQDEMEKARKLYYQLLPIAQAISAPENFPTPVKEAVSILGRPAGPARSPIIPIGEEEKEKIRLALRVAGLL